MSYLIVIRIRLFAHLRPAELVIPNNKFLIPDLSVKCLLSDINSRDIKYLI